MCDEPVIVVWAIVEPMTGSQLYVALTVTSTGSPTFEVPFGKLMHTSAGSAMDAVPPFLSSSVVAWSTRYCWREPPPGFLLTTAQRAPSFARCVSSIQ